MVNRNLDFFVFARQTCPSSRCRPATLCFRWASQRDDVRDPSGRVDIMMMNASPFDSRCVRQAFGIMSMINKLPRLATARVTENARLAVIDRTQYYFMLYEVPSFAVFLESTRFLNGCW